MKISLVIVTHFSSGVLPACVSSFKREATAEGHDLQIVIVEHSETAAETAAVSALGVDLVLERPNGGYAAGLNAGVACTDGEVLLLANPDIVLLEGCLRPLLEALNRGFSVVGPKLFWDSAAGVLLPPPEDPSPRGELRRILRRRWPWYWRWRLGAELENIHRHWSSSRPLEVGNLRGPLLVLSRADWRRFGEMNEDYFLYYEETEWLSRARRVGARLAIAGRSALVHRWGHATSRRADAGAIEEASRRRFMERNYPRCVRRAVGCLQTRTVCPFSPEIIEDISSLPDVTADLWLFSPFEHLAPAAGWVGDGGDPALAASLFTGGPWYAMAAERSPRGWKIKGVWTWRGDTRE
ncbi:MAG: glycosyltransferase [Thermoanaerobaculales bacterium]|nr:glycosyltransferase [Thermoanaerobaculales bacterium]